MKNKRRLRNESINSKKALNKSLEDNVNLFMEFFKDDDTVSVRYFSNREQDMIKFCIIYIDGMVDPETVNRNILQPIIQRTFPKNFYGNMDVVLEQIVIANNAEKLCNVDELVVRILRGESVLLMDKSDEAIAICTKGWKSRSITEPENEKVQRGPKEGFVEPVLVNLSMIRRRLPTPNLKFKKLVIGVQSKTDVYVCYLDNIVNKQILDELLKRLKNISYDGILSTGTLGELIEDAPYSCFDTIGSTERPDTAAALMLTGRIIVLADGSPTALTLPFLFEEYFRSNEDYYINIYFSSISRIIRILSFIITVLAPGLYVAILTFHQEMVPTPLLYSLSAAREGIPFPTILETLGLLFVFEILREAGLRITLQMGQSISILGALVLGTAAVDARIVSAPVIIVVAISGLTGMMTLKIKGASIIIRLIMVLLAGFLGLYGMVFGIMAIVFHLCTLRSFGVPYLLTLTSLKPEMVLDTAIRAPIWFLEKRIRFIAGENRGHIGEKE
ncbi:MAG: spore germination protein [Clostridiaceae bacterium]|nr:spore germination protein [Clostridiaceae bacterium]